VSGGGQIDVLVAAKGVVLAALQEDVAEDHGGGVLEEGGREVFLFLSLLYTYLYY